jgi:hypothetical protein
MPGRASRQERTMARRAAILAMVREVVRRDGQAPTIREVAAAVDTCLSMTARDLRELAQAGELVAVAGEGRSRRYQLPWQRTVLPGDEVVVRLRYGVVVRATLVEVAASGEDKAAA